MHVSVNRASDQDVAKCQNCPIRYKSFCHAAEGAAFEELTRISRIRAFRVGETIIGQNDASYIVGNVIKGILKLVKTLPDGRTHIVGLVHPSDFFGRVYSGNSEFALEASTDVELCCIDRTAFEQFLARHPHIEHELYLASLSQLDAARERIMLLACQNTLERLASYLAIRLLEAEAATPEGESRRSIVHSPINRRDFAGYLGTTVETISRNVQYLSRSGVIRILDSGHFEVLKRQQLFRLTGQSEEDLASTLAPARRPPLHKPQPSSLPAVRAVVKPKPRGAVMNGSSRVRPAVAPRLVAVSSGPEGVGRR